MAVSEGTQVLIYAAIICIGTFVIGVFYKKVLAPIIAKRFPPSAPLHGQEHGSSHGHGGGGHSGNGVPVAQGSTKVHEDYVRQMEMGTVRA